MKIITLVLALLTVLTVPTMAQTSSATEELFQIKGYTWGESSSPSYPLCDGCPDTELAQDYRWSHRKGAGVFGAWITLKNVSRKPIKSVSVEFVFRDSATESELLTYSFRFEKEIGRGKTKELGHKIPKGKEPDNFRPAAPSYQSLDRTRFCARGPLALDVKTKQLVRIRDNDKLLRTYPCYYTPKVTRIEYTDGSVWQP